MKSFLKNLAKYHLDNYKDELSEFCFVFPSRRACHFFKSELSSLTTEPVWSPSIITISDFFKLYNNTPVSDNITLIFKLHKVYQEVMSSDISIDEFLNFGDIFLNDFNDIDNYMVDAQTLMSNIHDLKELENDYSYLSEEQIKVIEKFWDSFNSSSLSTHQEGFLDLWKKMPKLYSKFRALLTSEGIAYQGMVARQIAESIEKEKFIENKFTKVVFAGFNALNKCEKKIFDQLYKQDSATFFWDYPEWILPTSSSDEEFQHEAYRFMAYNLEKLPSPKDWDNQFCNDFPDITISTATNELEQASITYDYLKNIDTKNTVSEKTGVILADETLLLPTLYSIPKEYESINITLGYPIKNTPAFALIDALLSLQKSTRVTKEGKIWFYHRDVISILRHQYFNLILENRGHKSITNIIKAKQIYIPSSVFEEDEILKAIFKKVANTQELEDYLYNILLLIYKKISEKEDTKLEQEFVFYLYTSIKRLSDILSNLEQKPAPETWQSLFKKLIVKQSVPFKGEPLKGLQVMGILESRAIDFENLIILGLAEGIFPKATPPMTFIPFNLRKGYELPTIDNQDSIFAYYFYRLIHRAKNIKLVYASNKALTEESEMSRFLQQLYYEYPGKITIQNTKQEINIQNIRPLKAEKDENVLEVLKEWTKEERPLSPSALSEYLQCPLKFYYKYVAKIKETDELDEDLNARTFGNIFHEVIQRIYEPFIGKTINNDEIEPIIKDTEEIRNKIQTAFDKEFRTDKSTRKLYSDLQGKNSLVFEVIFKYIVHFLKIEKARVPFTIIKLEESEKTDYQLNDGRTIYIGGKIDRVELDNGKLTIYDYKTGNAENNFSKIEELFNQKNHGKKRAIFQTLLYSMVMNRSGHSNDIIYPSIIPLRDIFKSENFDILFGKITANYSETEITEPFEEQLSEKLNELFNPQIPFIQTDILENCKHCNFKEHCLKS